MSSQGRYGLDPRVATAVLIACNDLSRTVNTLEHHHAEELPAMDAAIAAFATELDAAPDAEPGRMPALLQARDIETAAIGMRSQRGVLLEHLLAMRAALVDVMLEAHALQPADVALGAHVEPHATPPAPTPLGAPDLEGRLRLMDKTLKWSRQATYSQAVMALGPAHLLAHLIEHPAPEAEALRADLIEASERLRGFIVRTFPY